MPHLVRLPTWERSLSRRDWMPTEKEKMLKPLSLTSPYSPSFIPRGKQKQHLSGKRESESTENTEGLYPTPSAGLQPRPIHAGKEYRSYTIIFRVLILPWAGHVNFWIGTLFYNRFFLYPECYYLRVTKTSWVCPSLQLEAGFLP